MNDFEQLRAYEPKGDAEAAELAEILRWMDLFPDTVLLRDCPAHLTASTFVVNADASKILFAYHNIFDAWAWLGGHADGDGDLLAVALRELEEETGITRYRPLTGEIDSVDILPVWMHQKRGRVVPSHLHLNVSYLVVAEEGQPLRAAEGENQAVAWIPADKMMEYSGELDMTYTYEKLLHQAQELLGGEARKGNDGNE